MFLSSRSLSLARGLTTKSYHSAISVHHGCMSSLVVGNFMNNVHGNATKQVMNTTNLLQHCRNHNTYHGPGKFEDRETAPGHHHPHHHHHHRHQSWKERGFTVGIGGPVGSGKTALVLQLTLALRDEYPSLGVVTNDIFTQEDAEFLVRNNALSSDRIAAVETGGCPHAAIREDVSANLAALEKLTHTAPQGKEDDDETVLLLCESGGDNLAANFSRELADFTIYVIDVAGGDKVPRKGGPGITQSDLLVINKIDLAEAVGADLDVMKRDTIMMRGTEGPTVFASVKHVKGVPEIKQQILKHFEMATAKKE
mmetsp:Transcript_5100/g.7758  ORF Transcript_5100/g.7758 Transcript_5100/m.7758 type:complete len:311 (-) Transcript_5100:193-1125(-)|eukprot:CAMPEP_0195304442 /NCGR_PEP_ID=MMETSP0707-20130614/34444_1 /TAXON_ID=33640 /ORGANISM="Asterionellopsis glacialis, Strain CCMP134" /LENGTH=310 /DNA_ID=CAMNT_0040368241 /DNA_START=42 /DNA_END=974 /DNA_ORIENTATION=-